MHEGIGQEVVAECTEKHAKAYAQVLRECGEQAVALEKVTPF
jgi:hypothetical protein